MNAHEEAFVRNFIVKEKRERTLLMLASAKGRPKFRKSLAHFGDLDASHAKVVKASEAHTVDEWVKLLKTKGAPATCWVVSEDSDLDARELSLYEAMKDAHGAGMGTLLSCVAGKLCYFEYEDGRWLLERRSGL